MRHGGLLGEVTARASECASIADLQRANSDKNQANSGKSWRRETAREMLGMLYRDLAIGYHQPMKKQIAIVEDEPALRENYAAALARQGYQVKTYANRKLAMQAFNLRLPDLAIIDISLEDEAEGGFDLCRDLRALSAELPIVFLTARDSELDAVSGLRLGADDFLTKDVSLPHLAARVAALFRRIDALRQPGDAAQILHRGALAIDAQKLQTTWNGTPVVLSLTEFWIVHALARNPGHVKNRQQLMDAANVVLDDDTITSHIKRVRRKFIAVDAGFDAIQTVYGMGYRWVE
jgi:two-component system, OmpR family, response regulator